MAAVALPVAAYAQEPMPRMRMIDGFNEGWIAFEGNEADIAKGEVQLETVLRALVSQAD